jgi:hypothetical protein
MEKKETLKSNERMNPFIWLAVLLIFILSIEQFINNYKYCDNHLNWLNHDYCKNLMVSTEEDSIFMTEGGDNQVFGTLYFTYAEKLRPDITPYDQIANIFKKIYGDLRYAVGAESIKKRKYLVDAHIFESEQPFYNDIRQTEDPYFIPYWEGRRPVYLTWQRPEQWKLGDYFYKRYGMMFKVMDIAYSLVDYLEIKKSISIKEAQEQFSIWLHRPIDLTYTLNKIAMMEKSGCIKTVSDRVEFVKMYPSPFEGDYFNNFLLRWHEFPNAKHWDVLSREIIVNNFDFTFGEIYWDKINILREIKSHEKNSFALTAIDKEINDYWHKAKEYFEDAVVYGSDFSSVLNNIAIIYLKNGLEDLDEEARKLLIRALEISKNQFGIYYTLLSFLILDSYKHPDYEITNIREADRWLAQLQEEAYHYRSENTRQAILRNFAVFNNFIASLKQTPSSTLEAATLSLKKELLSKPAAVNAGQAENVIDLLYSRGIPFQYKPYTEMANDLFDILLAQNKNNYNYLFRAFSTAYQVQRLDKAYEIGKILEGHDSYSTDFSFNYCMGTVCYFLKRYKDCRNYLDRFFGILNSNKDLQSKATDMIKNAEEILKLIKSEENRM